LNPKKILKKVLNSKANVRFQEFVSLVEAFGFQLSRINGSHHIFIHIQFKHSINIQNDNGNAKPYQIHQFLKLIERYNIEMIGDEI
jgi:predicted RNA binding protein YcfA (HicA-like mRNA interferase family)